MRKFLLYLYIIIIILTSVSCSTGTKDKSYFDEELKFNTEKSTDAPVIINENEVPLANIDSTDITEIIYIAKPLKAEFVVENTWSENGIYYTQFKVYIKNITENRIKSWKLELDLPLETVFEQGWNGVYTCENSILSVDNKSYNGIISSENSINIGFIIGTKKIFNPEKYIIEYTN